MISEKHRYNGNQPSCVLATSVINTVLFCPVDFELGKFPLVEEITTETAPILMSQKKYTNCYCDQDLSKWTHYTINTLHSCFYKANVNKWQRGNMKHQKSMGSGSRCSWVQICEPEQDIKLLSSTSLISKMQMTMSTLQGCSEDWKGHVKCLAHP